MVDSIRDRRRVRSFSFVEIDGRRALGELFFQKFIAFSGGKKYDRHFF